MDLFPVRCGGLGQPAKQSHCMSLPHTWRRCRSLQFHHPNVWSCLPRCTPTLGYFLVCHCPPVPQSLLVMSNSEVTQFTHLDLKKPFKNWYLRFFCLCPPVNKPYYRSMENLNSNSAFQGSNNKSSMASSRFPTLPLSGFTFAPNSPSFPTANPSAKESPPVSTLPSNPRVVPTITRSQSSSNLPENLMENPYDEIGGGLGNHINQRMPKKSCSQWDMVEASGKRNHLQVGRRETLRTRHNTQKST